MRHIAKITGIRRSLDGELVADANFRDSGLIHGMANTFDNFQMDDEILLLAIRRDQATKIWTQLGAGVEAVEKDYGVDADLLWKFVEQLKPDELPEIAPTPVEVPVVLV